MPDAYEVTASHIGICKRLADRYARDNPVHDFDDLFQEAQLAVWLESSKRPGDDMRRLASTVAQRRIQRVVTGRKGPHKPKYVDSIESAFYEAEEALGYEESAEQAALLRMKREQVRNAVSALLPRQRIAAEDFMAEMPASATAARVGLNKCTIELDRKAAFETLRVLLEDHS